MIKYKKNGGEVALSVAGDLATITAEATMLLSVIYQKLKESDKQSAFAFRFGVTESVRSGLPFDLVDKEEEEAEDDVMKAIKKVFDDKK